MVFDLPKAQHLGLPGRLQHQRLQQKGPVGGDGRGAVLSGEGEKIIPLIGVGTGQYRAVTVQPLDQQGVVHAIAVFIPAGRVGAAKAVQQVVGAGQA